MKLSNDCLCETRDSLQAKLDAYQDLTKKEYEDLEQRLSTEKNDLEQRLTNEKDELEKNLSTKITNLEETSLKGADEIRSNLLKERREMEEKLTKEVVDLKRSRDSEVSSLKSTIEGFQDMTNGCHKQIAQIEVNNANLQYKMVAVQEERDEARKSTQTLHVQKTQVDESLARSEQNLKKQIDESNESKEEIALLTKQLEEVVDLSTRYKEKLESTTKNVETLQCELEKGNLSVSRLTKELKEVRENYNTLLEDSKDVPELRNKISELNSQMSSLTLSKDSLTESLAKMSDECSSLRSNLSVASAEKEKRQSLINLYLKAFRELDSLRDPSRIDGSGELDVENIVKILSDERREMRNKLKSKESDFENEKAISVELSERLTRKDIEIVQMKETTTKSTDEELKSIERLREELTKEHKRNVNSLSEEWKEKSSQMVLDREIELQERMDELTDEWTNERKELERVTQVASTAFKSGTDSVDLLKKQVTAQRNELDQVKFKHRKEVSELQALLEVKRRRKAGHDNRLVGSLENSAEFEYLQNVLYQYMVGKETKTLSKVLCAVVKFDKDQQTQIGEAEERRLNMLREMNGEEKLRVSESENDPVSESPMIKCT